MPTFLEQIWESWLGIGAWWLAFFIGFGLLARFMPCNPGQPLLRRGMLTDILYGLLLPVFSRFITIAYLMVGIGLLFYDVPKNELNDYFTQGHGPLATLPLWLQAALVFIIADIMLYWAHRLFHHPRLWPWHAIHHSSKQVDWLSTHRFHPVNVWLSFTLVDVLLLLAGFSPEATLLMAGVNTIYSAMVHANLNWTFGPLRYVFASPVFHRWHHTTQKEGLDKNFAPTFPLLDIMFGTFYMPEGRLPERFGVHGADIPDSFIGQLAWPFKQQKK